MESVTSTSIDGVNATNQGDRMIFTPVITAPDWYWSIGFRGDHGAGVGSGRSIGLLPEQDPESEL